MCARVREFVFVCVCVCVCVCVYAAAVVVAVVVVVVAVLAYILELRKSTLLVCWRECWCFRLLLVFELFGSV